MIRGKFLNGYTDNLEECFEVRRKVFMEEQNISEEDELDGMDEKCGHYIVYNEADIPVSTGRLIRVSDDVFKIGRVATLKEHRHKGYAEFLMLALIEKARSLGAKEIILYAQIPAAPFYEKCGFKKESDEIYMDAEIEHYKMIYDFESHKCSTCCQ